MIKAMLVFGLLVFPSACKASVKRDPSRVTSIDPAMVKVTMDGEYLVFSAPSTYKIDVPSCGYGGIDLQVKELATDTPTNQWDWSNVPSSDEVNTWLVDGVVDHPHESDCDTGITHSSETLSGKTIRLEKNKLKHEGQKPDPDHAGTLIPSFVTVPIYSNIVTLTIKGITPAGKTITTNYSHEVVKQ